MAGGYILSLVSKFHSMPLAAVLASLFYLFAVIVSMAAEDLRPVFLAAASLSLAALIGGFLFFPRQKAFIVFKIPRATEGNELRPPLVLSGVTVGQEAYEQRLICTVHIRGVAQLFAIAGVAVAAIVVLTSPRASYEAYTHGGFAVWRIYFAILIGWMVLSRSVHWLSECRTLRRSRAVIGALRVLSSTSVPVLDYQFPDPQGERRGGRAVGDAPKQDNGAVVFYDPGNPDRNIPHHALVFHSLAVQVVAGT